MLMFCSSTGTLGTSDGVSLSQDEWLRQFDVSLPGCTLKKQVDILALIKQVSRHDRVAAAAPLVVQLQLSEAHVTCSRRSSRTERTNRRSTATQPT